MVLRIWPSTRESASRPNYPKYLNSETYPKVSQSNVRKRDAIILGCIILWCNAYSFLWSDQQDVHSVTQTKRIGHCTIYYSVSISMSSQTRKIFLKK